MSDIFNIMWYIYGFTLIGIEGTCSKTEPVFYYYMTVMISINSLLVIIYTVIKAIRYFFTKTYYDGFSPEDLEKNDYGIFTVKNIDDQNITLAPIESSNTSESINISSHVEIPVGPLGLDNVSCFICMKFYRTSDNVRQLNCKHRAHRKCIDRWLTQDDSCPVCRKGKPNGTVLINDV